MKIVGPLPRILGHEATLTQVFSNLLGNATKFVAPGTRPHITIWSEDVGDRARIYVEDNGIGIKAENHDRIFQMFVQLNESQLYGGTGIGLAIVKKAVESMEGRSGWLRWKREAPAFGWSWPRRHKSLSASSRNCLGEAFL